MRQQAPAGELRCVAGFPGAEEHHAEGEVGREANGWFEREVSLLRRREERAVSLRCSPRCQIHVCFQRILPAIHRLVLVNLNFERVLRGCPVSKQESQRKPPGTRHYTGNCAVIFGFGWPSLYGVRTMLRSSSVTLSPSRTISLWKFGLSA